MQYLKDVISNLDIYNKYKGGIHCGLTGKIGPRGDAGTSIRILGSYSTLEELIKYHSKSNQGDAYKVNNHLYVYKNGEWNSAGIIGGDKGEVGDIGDTGLSELITSIKVEEVDANARVKIFDTKVKGMHSLLVKIPTGFHGVNGVVGEKGETGDQGEVGDKGPIGFMGPKGLSGLVGEPGLIGPKGPTGDIGLQGSKGEIGNKGEDGSIGEKGPTGEKGPSGNPGIQGPPGLKGNQVDIASYLLASTEDNTIVKGNSIVYDNNIFIEKSLIKHNENTSTFTLISGYKYYIKVYVSGVSSGSDWLSGNINIDGQNSYTLRCKNVGGYGSVIGSTIVLADKDLTLSIVMGSDLTNLISVINIMALKK